MTDMMELMKSHAASMMKRPRTAFRRRSFAFWRPSALTGDMRYATPAQAMKTVMMRAPIETPKFMRFCRTCRTHPQAAPDSGTVPPGPVMLKQLHAAGTMGPKKVETAACAVGAMRKNEPTVKATNVGENIPNDNSLFISFSMGY
jgi:hypothetical protein